MTIKHFLYIKWINIITGNCCCSEALSSRFTSHQLHFHLFAAIKSSRSVRSVLSTWLEQLNIKHILWLLCWTPLTPATSLHLWDCLIILFPSTVAGRPPPPPSCVSLLHIERVSQKKWKPKDKHGAEPNVNFCVISAIKQVLTMFPPPLPAFINSKTHTLTHRETDRGD